MLNVHKKHKSKGEKNKTNIFLEQKKPHSAAFCMAKSRRVRFDSEDGARKPTQIPYFYCSRVCIGYHPLSAKSIEKYRFNRILMNAQERQMSTGGVVRVVITLRYTLYNKYYIPETQDVVRC